MVRLISRQESPSLFTRIRMKTAKNQSASSKPCNFHIGDTLRSPTRSDQKSEQRLPRAVIRKCTTAFRKRREEQPDAVGSIPDISSYCGDIHNWERADLEARCWVQGKRRTRRMWPAYPYPLKQKKKARSPKPSRRTVVTLKTAPGSTTKFSDVLNEELVVKISQNHIDVIRF